MYLFDLLFFLQHPIRLCSLKFPFVSQFLNVRFGEGEFAFQFDHLLFPSFRQFLQLVLRQSSQFKLFARGLDLYV